MKRQHMPESPRGLMQLASVHGHYRQSKLNRLIASQSEVYPQMRT